jgi:hypothetical protein
MLQRGDGGSSSNSGGRGVKRRRINGGETVEGEDRSSSSNSCRFDAVLATDPNTTYFTEACMQVDAHQIESAPGASADGADGGERGGGAAVGKAELMEGHLVNVTYDATRWAGRADEWHIVVQATK